MSATSVDPQGTKGQDANAHSGSLQPKETVPDADFEPYLPGQSSQERQNRSKQ
uniref:YTH N6-methyladenosine RNA binding protein F1 n=1 Tax=Oryctolagus cuniculus TaxID=9986 RepID=A0A5F9DBZ0_RABIT